MTLILLVLLLAIILGGLGFALHVLWWIAAIVLLIWLIGFVIRVGEGRRRWCRWGAERGGSWLGTPLPPPGPRGFSRLEDGPAARRRRRRLPFATSGTACS
jgi:hypothetical protein